VAPLRWLVDPFQLSFIPLAQTSSYATGHNGLIANNEAIRTFRRTWRKTLPHLDWFWYFALFSKKLLS